MGDRVGELRWDVVLFDIGGVLVRQDFGVFAHVLRPDTDAAAWARWMLGSDAARDFERGRAPPDRFASAVADGMGAPGVTAAAVLAAFDAWVVAPFDGALELLDEVRRAGPRVGCLSNCNVVHAPRLVTMGFAFDPAVFSHEIGLAKPDPAVYAAAGARAGADPARILFLDDNAVNVTAAREAGWEACHVRGADEARAALVTAGVLAAD